jgi:hypothetical protein
MIDDRGGCDGFTGARGSLDKTEWFLEHALDGVHLRVVELWETWGGESFGHLGAEDLGFEFVSEEFVVLV